MIKIPLDTFKLKCCIHILPPSLADLVESPEVLNISLTQFGNDWSDSDAWTANYVTKSDLFPSFYNIDNLNLETIRKICLHQASRIIEITPVQLSKILSQASETLRGDAKIPYPSWRTLNHLARLDNEVKLKIFNAGNIINANQYFVITNFGTYVVELTDEFLALKNIKVKEDNNTMNINASTINASTINFECGPITNGAVVISPYGLAIKNNNKIYTYNAATKQIVDVTGFTVDMKGIIYKIPAAIKDVRPGDMILHQGKPMYVTNLNEANVEAIDILNAESKNIVPVTNMFGFNFVTKVVSIVNMPTAVPNADQPFGNLMPMMMMSAVFGGNEDEHGDSNGLFGDIDLGKMFMLSYFMGGDNPFSKMFNFGTLSGTANTEAK